MSAKREPIVPALLDHAPWRGRYGRDASGPSIHVERFHHGRDKGRTLIDFEKFETVRSSGESACPARLARVK
jgi:hypothetical protein